MKQRWIKLYPQILKSPVFSDPELLQTWIWCLCMASYKERDIINSRKQIVHLRKGEFYCGLQTSAESLGITRNTLKRRLEKLEELEMITLKVGHLGTLIFINNFSNFQNNTDIKRTYNEATGGHTMKHKIEYKYNISRKEIEDGACAEKIPDGELSEKAKRAMARRE